MNNHMQMTITDGTTTYDLNSVENSTYLQPEITGLTTLPDIRTSSGTNIGADGGWTSAQFFDARLITINGVIANHDVAVVEQKRKQLNALLAKRKLRLSFVTESGSSYAVDVRVVSVTMSLGTLLNAQTFSINFRADDPLIYDNTSGGDLIATLLVQRLLGGFEINFNIPFEITGGGTVSNVVNTGNSDVLPTIILTGPLHSPTIVNYTTNQQMQISVDMSANDEIVIDSRFETITMNGMDIFDLKTESSQFITLSSGNNSMVLQSAVDTDAGTAQIKYKSGYYSI